MAESESPLRDLREAAERMASDAETILDTMNLTSDQDQAVRKAILLIDEATRELDNAI